MASASASRHRATCHGPCRGGPTRAAASRPAHPDPVGQVRRAVLGLGHRRETTDLRHPCHQAAPMLIGNRRPGSRRSVPRHRASRSASVAVSRRAPRPSRSASTSARRASSRSSTSMSRGRRPRSRPGARSPRRRARSPRRRRPSASASSTRPPYIGPGELGVAQAGDPLAARCRGCARASVSRPVRTARGPGDDRVIEATDTLSCWSFAPVEELAGPRPSDRGRPARRRRWPRGTRPGAARVPGAAPTRRLRATRPPASSRSAAHLEDRSTGWSRRGGGRSRVELERPLPASAASRIIGSPARSRRGSRVAMPEAAEGVGLDVARTERPGPARSPAVRRRRLARVL